MTSTNRWAIYFYLEGKTTDNSLGTTSGNFVPSSEPAFVGTMDECVAFAENEGLTRCVFAPFRSADEALAQERHDHPILPDDEHHIEIEDEREPEEESKKRIDWYNLGTLAIIIILIVFFSGSIIWHSIPSTDLKRLLFQHQ